MIKPYKKLGHVTLGSQLRIFADMITSDAASTYEQFGLNIDPKWFPVFYVLASSENSTVTTIAPTIGHSHVSVSKIVSEMKRADLITSNKCRSDSRKTLINLSPKGKELVPNLLRQIEYVDFALEQLTKETGVNLWEALEVTRQKLEYMPLSRRIENLRSSGT